MCVCLDVYEWLGASVYCISSPTVLHSSSAAAEILDRLAASSVPSTSRLSKTPVLSSSSSSFFLSQHKTASLYVHSSFRVSCYEAVGSPFVQLKLPPFCLSGFFFFFYPCANRRGRVPELDPIFHARLPFVWHTPPLIRIPVLGPLWYWNPTVAQKEPSIIHYLCSSDYHSISRVHALHHRPPELWPSPERTRIP